jgi:hypothetical protein
VNVIQILTLILQYKDEIIELIKLIERLFAEQPYASTAELAAQVEQEYPTLAKGNLLELIEFLLQNKDSIIELIDYIKSLFKGN